MTGNHTQDAHTVRGIPRKDNALDPDIDLAIVGSCVSRDALEFHPDGFNLLGYFARTSLISQATEPVEIGNDDLESDLSPFARRVVEQDLTSNVVASLGELSPRILLLDLIDERFRIVRSGSGWITYSPYFSQTSLGKSLANAPALALLDNERLPLFKESVATLANQINATLPNVRMVVHRAFYAEFYRDEDGTKPFDPSALEAARVVNELMRTMYDHLSATLRSAASIEVTPDLVVADAQHKWGLDHFHYVPDYYLCLMRQLSSVVDTGWARHC